MFQTKIKHVKDVYDQVKSARNKNKYSKRRCDYAQYYKKCKVKNIVLKKLKCPETLRNQSTK